MRNRRLKSIALFSGSFFLLLLLFFSTRLYAISGRILSPEKKTAGTPTGLPCRHRPFCDKSDAANPMFNQHSRINGKAGHPDRVHVETDLFAGANKAGAPAASQALASEQ